MRLPSSVRGIVKLSSTVCASASAISPPPLGGASATMASVISGRGVHSQTSTISGTGIVCGGAAGGGGGGGNGDGEGGGYTSGGGGDHGGGGEAENGGVYGGLEGSGGDGEAGDGFAQQ